MRRMPVRRRSRPTMSCDVGPTGLSRLTTPSIGPGELSLALGQNQVTCGIEWMLQRAAGGTSMPAPAEGAGDRHRVRPLGGAHADARHVRIGLLEQDGDVR